MPTVLASHVPLYHHHHLHHINQLITRLSSSPPAHLLISPRFIDFPFSHPRCIHPAVLPHPSPQHAHHHVSTSRPTNRRFPATGRTVQVSSDRLDLAVRTVLPQASAGPTQCASQPPPQLGTPAQCSLHAPIRRTHSRHVHH